MKAVDRLIGWPEGGIRGSVEQGDAFITLGFMLVFHLANWPTVQRVN